MKKLILALAVAFTAFTSCTSDDNKTENVTTQDALVTKWTETHANGEVYTATYSYNGNQIDKITYGIDNSFQKYTYTGNLITKIEQIKSDNTVTATTELEYDSSNRLVKEITIEDRDGETITFTSIYTHNDIDGTITEKYEDRSTATNDVNTIEKVYYIKDNEISKTVYPFNNYITEFKYKAENNPFKNIVGFDKIYFSFYFGENGNLKNLESKISHDTTYEYDYISFNNKNYPTELVETYSKEGHRNSTIQIKIEYSI